MSTILVIAASHGENLSLAQRFVNASQDLGYPAEVLDLTTVDLPLFSSRAQANLAADKLEILKCLEAKLAASPHWVICAPEYNGSIPPILTSAIAWLSVQGNDFRSLFNRRPIAMATHSGGGGHELLAALRIQLAHLGANVVGRQLVTNSSKLAKDESIIEILKTLVAIH